MDLIIASILIALVFGFLFVRMQTINSGIRRLITQVQISNIDPCNHEWETVTNDKIETDAEVRLVIIQKCSICGKLDKSIEVIEKICRHNWAILSDKINSPIKDMATMDSWLVEQLDTDKIVSQKWLHKCTRVLVCTCLKCGELDKTVTIDE